MSYEERRSVVALISTVIINIVYAAVMLPRFPDVGDYDPEVFRFWAGYMLILIPVTVVVKIIIHIVFVILNAITTGEYDEERVDEREQLIELKSTQVSLYVFSLGFIAAIATQALEEPPTLMFVLFIGTGILTDAVSELAQLYYRRRGI